MSLGKALGVTALLFGAFTLGLSIRSPEEARQHAAQQATDKASREAVEAEILSAVTAKESSIREAWSSGNWGVADRNSCRNYAESLLKKAETKGTKLAVRQARKLDQTCIAY